MSCQSSIWHRDSNPQPLKNESSTIATRRPGFQPAMFIHMSQLNKITWLIEIGRTVVNITNISCHVL